MNRIRNILQPVAGFLPIERWIALSRQKVFCPFYHTVSNRPLPYIAPHYRVRSEREFETDLDFLLRHFSPVDWKDLQAIANGKTIAQPVFFLSFDDGLRELYEIVAPMLLRKGVPATFFINPDFIHHKTWMHRYKAALLIEKLMTRKASDISVSQILNTTDHANLGSLAERLEVDFDEEWHRWQPYLSVDELQRLEQQGFTIASHSIGHPHFASLTTDEQLQNIRNSFGMMNDMKLKPAPLFAFPFSDIGVKRKFFSRCYSELPLQLTFGTAGLKQDVDERHIHRFPVENFDAPLQQTAPAEYFYYLLKKPFGKNSIHRS